jgi:serine/threonine protein kinase
MEPIKYSLESFIEHKHGIQLDWFAPFLKQLGHTLDVLKRKYNFTHRDLHLKNVMIDATGALKLIDFGYRCMEFRGLHYHNIDIHKLESVKCIPGLDLAIFFAAFFETFFDEIHANPAVKTIFSRKYFICQYGGRPFGFFALARELNKAAPHFAFYHFRIKPHTRRSIENLPILKPDVLERVADGILSGVDYAPAITFPV